MKKLLAYGTLCTMFLGLVGGVWGMSGSWNSLNAKVDLKADKKELSRIDIKLDKILCSLTKKDKYCLPGE